MELKKYFDETKGFGVLSSADSKGNVDSAVYARPHVIDGETVAFIMCQHTTHQNISETLKACYLFRENGDGYKGKRLYLTKLREDSNKSLIDQLHAERPDSYHNRDDSQKFVVFFRVDTERPLIGG